MRQLLLTGIALGIHVAALAQPRPADTPSTPTQTTPGAQFYEPERDIAIRDAAATAAEGRAVASSADPRATAAGTEMLAKGGSAADAALAIAIALTVAEPQSSGLGGGGFLVFHDAKTGRTYTLDGREKAPASAGPDRFLKPDGTPMGFANAVPGGYSVGVPGTVALLAEAHKRWGKLPWATLFAPAIRLADEGIVVSERLNRFSGSFQSMLVASPAAARIFLDANGKPWPIGHVLKQPELAATLRMLAADGPDAFYKGPIGAEISKAVANAFRNPTALTAQDLAAYRVGDRPPLCRPYRQWKICAMGPPSSGGIAVLQIMMQLERFDLAKLGPKSLTAQHLFAESQRLAYADREAFGADADFVQVPVEGLLEPAYIRARSALIRPDAAMAEARAGTPRGMKTANRAPLIDIPSTSHIVSADAAGNVATYTSTIEGPFGSGLVAAGFLLNNELTDFDMAPVRDGNPAPNRVQPGKRPRSSMSPVIVYDAKGKPVAAFGAAGGATIIAQVAKALIARLDWGLPVEEAVALPQVIADRSGLRYEAGTFLAEMAPGFTALGHQNVRGGTLPLKGGGLTASPKGWRAAADPRSEGQAMAVGEGVGGGARK